MSNILDFELGVPSKRKRFLKSHVHYFERLPSLQKTLKDLFKQKKRQNTFDLLVYTLCENCIREFDELILLCGNGYGEAGLKLLAEMFENFILVRNLHLHPDKTNNFLNVISLISQNINNDPKENHTNFTLFNELNIFWSDLENKNLLSKPSKNTFIELVDSAGLSDELKYVFHLSLQYAYPSITQILPILYGNKTVLPYKEHVPPKNTSDIVFTTAYYLVVEILLLMIEHFNLNQSNPLYQQYLDDYRYFLEKEQTIFRISGKLDKNKKSLENESKRKPSTEDYKAKSDKILEENPIVQDSQYKVGVGLDELTNLYLLESIKGLGPQKFKVLHESNISLQEVIQNPKHLLRFGKQGKLFQSELLEILNTSYEECRYRAIYQISTAFKNNAKIITYNHPAYPRNVFLSNNAMPVLYVRGSLEVLSQNKVVACVGSRKIRSPYYYLHQEFAKEASREQFTIASGFALGADRLGHETAFRSGGSTICVMPCGLEKPFPPESKELWNELLNYEGATFVSEFPFGIRTSSLTLRKRNKLIVAFSLGVLIGQSSIKGGAMNAYRFAREQRKPVATFVADESEETSGNDLIRKEQMNGDAILPLSNDTEAYQKWLQELYYLT